MVKRAAKAKMFEPSEAMIQTTVVQHLHLRGRPDVWWFHVPNGERRDAVTGAKLKRMGVKAGTPDLLFLIAGKLHCLELKRGNGRPSAAQKATKIHIEKAGGVHEYGRGLNECLDVLERWGVFLVNRQRSVDAHVVA